MRDTYRPIAVGKFAAIIALFFLPFVEMSCQSHSFLEIDGIQFVTGDEVTLTSPIDGSTERHELESELYAVVAFVTAIVGLLGAFAFKGVAIRFCSLLTGIVGVVSLYLFKDKVESDVLESGEGLIQVSFLEGYWGAFVLFGFAILAALLSLLPGDRKE